MEKRSPAGLRRLRGFAASPPAAAFVRRGAAPSRLAKVRNGITGNGEVAMRPGALSIVIPAFNESGRLPATLSAIETYAIAQLGPTEVIVVDDGSTDDTLTIAESFARRCSGTFRVRALSHRLNRGKGASV